MDLEAQVEVLDPAKARAAAQAFLIDRTGWRAEYRELVWSHRLVIAAVGLLGGQQMLWGELVTKVQAMLDQASDDYVKRLDATELAKAIRAGMEPNEP